MEQAQHTQEQIGRLILEAGTGIHGYIAKDLAREWARVATQKEDLLEALQEIVKNDPFNQSSAGIIARAAIARATGQGE